MGLTRQRSKTEGRSCYGVTLVTAVVTVVIALFLQFVGFVTPGWIILASPAGIIVNAGVWYLQVCKRPDDTDTSGRCKTVSMTRIENPFNVVGDDADYVSMTEVQVETTLALVACITSVLLAVNALVQRRHAPASYLAWAAGTALASAGLLLIPVCRLLDILLHWDSHVAYHVPYSLVASGLSVLVAVISAMLLLIALVMVIYDLRRERRKSAAEERQDLTLGPS